MYSEAELPEAQALTESWLQNPKLFSQMSTGGVEVQEFILYFGRDTVRIKKKKKKNPNKPKHAAY